LFVPEHAGWTENRVSDLFFLTLELSAATART
jgi:hypothetical protein